MYFIFHYSNKKTSYIDRNNKFLDESLIFNEEVNYLLKTFATLD